MRFVERDWLSSNQVLFLDDDGGASLVDSGYLTHAPLTLSLVERLLEGRPLRRLLNTHLHSDHCGGNATLQRAFPDLHTRVPAGALATVRAWDEHALSFRATGQRCEPFRADGALQAGDVLRLGALDWQVLVAPGHDPLSVMLHCTEARLLISADALWENGFGVIFPELAGEEGFDDQRATLDLIATLPVDMVLPGHGRPFTDVAGALTRARSRLDYLSERPERNARNGLRVLVKFLLLEQRAFTLDVVERQLQEAAYFREINARFFGLPPETLARQVANELVASGVARWDGARLHDA